MNRNYCNIALQKWGKSPIDVTVTACTVALPLTVTKSDFLCHYLLFITWNSVAAITVSSSNVFCPIRCLFFSNSLTACHRLQSKNKIFIEFFKEYTVDCKNISFSFYLSLLNYLEICQPNTQVL